ncbi:hypothetical protein GSI_13372 [Ganoderma sinense ZZ0214-1]|uniref:Uncharacterized protein n=1 Tax=Ganoderma sinense ZZ0214-1 TaxID=1077348 RepID=A0A2G8RVE4_9APHY|nr:hypothetical protein GSI_13372 [Ganoderma sinense ZZ0214-1]
MVDAFLALPRLPDSADSGRTLGYVYEVAKDAKTTRAAGCIDALRAQLDELETRLTRHVSQGGARLHRLELCIAYSSVAPHPPPRAYPDISDVEPSTTLTGYLSGIYTPRFKVLVDEVVFMRGHGAAQTRTPGYRVVVRRVPWARRHLASPRAGGKGTASSPGPSRKGR